MSSSVLMFMRCFWSFLLIRFGFKYWPLPYLTGATNNIEEKNIIFKNEKKNDLY